MTTPTEIYKALADETRIRILSLLFIQDLCVCQLCGIMEVSQAKISRHLAKLRESGMVYTKREEQFIRYRLNRDELLLIDTLETLYRRINDYEILKRDQIRSEKKDEILAACKSS